MLQSVDQAINQSTNRSINLSMVQYNILRAYDTPALKKLHETSRHRTDIFHRNNRHDTPRVFSRWIGSIFIDQNETSHRFIYRRFLQVMSIQHRALDVEGPRGVPLQ